MEVTPVWWYLNRWWRVHRSLGLGGMGNSSKVISVTACAKAWKGRGIWEEWDGLSPSLSHFVLTLLSFPTPLIPHTFHSLTWRSSIFQWLDVIKKSLFWRLLNGKEDLIQDYCKGVKTITIGMRDGTQLWIQQRHLGIYSQWAHWGGQWIETC